MAGIRAAREEYLAANSTDTPVSYLTNKELTAQQTEFCIVNIEYKDSGKHGPFWLLSIVYLDEQGEHAEQSLILSAGSTDREGKYKENKYRRWLFTQQIKDNQAHFIKLVSKHNDKSNQDYYDIDDADGIEPCPCHTGDYTHRNGHLKELEQRVQQHAEEIAVITENPIVEDLAGARLHLKNLVASSGWPIPAASIDEMDMEQLRDLRRMLTGKKK